MITLYYESSFAHHGVKGQRWGVRRYQNPDGTLTEAGEKRLDRYRKKESAKIVKRYNLSELDQKINNGAHLLRDAEKNEKYGLVSKYENELLDNVYSRGFNKGLLHAELDKIGKMHMSDFKEEEMNTHREIAKRVLANTGLLALSLVTGPLIGGAAGVQYNSSLPSISTIKSAGRLDSELIRRIRDDEMDKVEKIRKTRVKS